MHRIALLALTGCAAATEPLTDGEPTPDTGSTSSTADTGGGEPESCGEPLESGEYAAGVFTATTPFQLAWLPLTTQPSPYVPVFRGAPCVDLDGVNLEFDPLDARLVWTGAAAFSYTWSVGLRDDAGWAPPGTNVELRVAIHRELPNGQTGVFELVTSIVSAEELANGVVLDVTQVPYNDTGISQQSSQANGSRWDLRVFWFTEVEQPPEATLSVIPEETELRIWSRRPAGGG